MPPRKDKTPAGRSAGTAAPVVARNPYATPEPSSTGQITPVRRYIVPPAAPMPETRAYGHVLTDRGWVREEGNTDG